MSLLSTIGLWVGGLLVGLGLGGYVESRRRSSDTEREKVDGLLVELEDGSAMWIGPRDHRTADAASTLNADASGQSITGTWTGFSGTEDADRPGPDDVPRGFRGEDLTDREVEEWLRENGLKGYE